MFKLSLYFIFVVLYLNVIFCFFVSCLDFVYFARLNICLYLNIVLTIVVSYIYLIISLCFTFYFIPSFYYYYFCWARSPFGPKFRPKFQLKRGLEAAKLTSRPIVIKAQGPTAQQSTWPASFSHTDQPPGLVDSPAGCIKRLNPTCLRFSQNRHSCYFTSASGSIREIVG